MDQLADIFNGRLFETTSLTAAINNVPYVPQVIGSMGLFEEEGVSDITVYVERKGSSISLVPAKERGAPGAVITGDKRDGIPFKIPHLPTESFIFPDEVQGVRMFGTTDQMATVESVRNDRLTKMSLSLDQTLEYHRLGALQGKVYDADGKTVLVDLYDRFELKELAAVEFDFSTAYDPNDPTKSGAIRKQLTDIRRTMTDELKMGPVAVARMGALCGDAFWDALTNCPEVRQTWLNQQEAADLRNSDTQAVCTYGSCDFINYRGTGAVKVADDDVRFFPVGIPGLFITRFGPADYMETVNTKGIPKYTKAGIDPSGKNKFISLEAQSNPLNLCTRPRTLRRGTIKN